MQQFTSNKTELLATIKRLRWYATGRTVASAHDSMSPVNSIENGGELTGYSKNAYRICSARSFWRVAWCTWFRYRTAGSFPGHKSMVVISEIFR